MENFVLIDEKLKFPYASDVSFDTFRALGRYIQFTLYIHHQLQQSEADQREATAQVQ